ncbi:MAG: transcriptional regulator, TetR family [Phenylobacterium sp.]|jgi:AcrR family transcriptional regulator|nr:transcriptional regulator, TetR family [Phenylobacterium sp.]
MRKGEATRLRILDEAARQAALRGLTGVSLGDVAEAVGLSKSGLFKHFESKEAMQRVIVEQVMDQFTAFVWKPAQHLPYGRARLELLFGRWLDWAESEWPQSGCPITAFSTELDDQPGDLRDDFQTRLRAWRKTMVGEIQRLRDPPLPEPEAQAAYFQMKSFVLGHSDARRMMGDADARRSAHAAFDALLDRTSRLAA